METKNNRDAAPKKRRDAKCSLCDATKEKEKPNAELFCEPCWEFLCTPCSRKHKADHNKLKVSADLITEKCGEHAEAFTKYCEEHDKLLCGSCFIMDHRSCNEVQSINESIKTLSADHRIRAVPADLRSALTNINRSISALSRHIEGCKNKKISYIEDLENKAKALMSRIEELKEKDKNAIKDTQEELRLRAEKRRKECDDIKKELDQRTVKIKRSKGCNGNMFVLKKNALQIIQAADTLSNESNSLINGCQFNVTTNMAIHEDLNCNSYLMKPSRMKASIRSINVRMPDDSCGINGCCVLGDGSLVIINTGLNKLKLIDPLNSTVIKQWNTKGRPLDVCCTGDKNFAVSFSSVILKYNADQTKAQPINLDQKDIQKMTWQDDLLYVSNKKTLYVYNLETGALSQSIEKDVKGQNLFVSPIQGIALNPEGNLVYVADANGLVCVNKEGHYQFRRTQDELKLKGAKGVVTDDRGSVFVSGWESSNVVEVTEQGNVVGEILSRDDGIERPYCLGFNVIDRQLYVGGGSDTLLVVSS